MGNGVSIRAAAFPTTSTDWARWGLGAVIVGLIYYAFWVQPVEGTMSCYVWLTGHWRYVSNYSHGPLIPLIAVGLVYLKWEEIRQVVYQPLWWGMAVVLGAMLFYYVGVKANVPRMVVFAFVMLLAGLALTLGGRDFYRILYFTIVYLLLMIPLNFLDDRLGFPLRILMARTSTALLNGMGVETIRSGTRIISTAFAFDVENPCSGIRSLMALLTVTAAFAYVTQSVQWKRWVMFLSAVPLAVLGNVARVLGVALVGHAYGQKVAMHVHDTAAGFIVFGVALTAMVAVGFLLNVPYRRMLNSWLKPVTPPVGSPLVAGASPSSREENHERVTRPSD